MAEPVQPDDHTLSILLANHRAFLAFLRKRVQSQEIAEDILQDSFRKALLHSTEVRQGESAVAWFYRVLRNAVIDHFRRKAVSERALKTLSLELAEPRFVAESQAEACACILRLTSLLKPQYADALRRIEVEGESIQQYAASEGMTTGAVSVRVHRARTALHTQVQRSCGTCATHGCFDCRCAGMATEAEPSA